MAESPAQRNWRIFKKIIGWKSPLQPVPEVVPPAEQVEEPVVEVKEVVEVQQITPYLELYFKHPFVSPQLARASEVLLRARGVDVRLIYLGQDEGRGICRLTYHRDKVKVDPLLKVLGAMLPRLNEVDSYVFEHTSQAKGAQLESEEPVYDLEEVRRRIEDFKKMNS